MPYAGGVYTLPPGTTATTLTAIDSSDYNAFIADIETAQNTARPVVAGGTGATSVITAHDALVTKGTTIASAATLNLDNANAFFVDVSGTVTVTVVTLTAGRQRMVLATGAFLLTASASLIVNGSASVNYTTAAGDLLVFEGYAGPLVRVWAVGNVTVGGTQTLTNKTITTPTLTLKQSAAAAPTGEGDIQWDTDDNILAIGDGAATRLFLPIPASVAAGDMFYASAAKVLARVAKGTASQIWTMNAGATAPEWASPAAGGGMTLLGTITTTSGASQSLSGLDLTSYMQVVLVFNGVSGSLATADLTCHGSTYTDFLNTDATDVVNGFLKFDLSAGIYESSLYVIGSAVSLVSGDGTLVNASTAITVAVSTGVFDGGSIRVYGVK